MRLVAPSLEVAKALTRRPKTAEHPYGAVGPHSNWLRSVSRANVSALACAPVRDPEPTGGTAPVVHISVSAAKRSAPGRGGFPRPAPVKNFPPVFDALGGGGQGFFPPGRGGKKEKPKGGR